MPKLKPTTFPKRTVFRVQWDKPRKKWVVTVGGMVLGQLATQKDAAESAARVAESLTTRCIRFAQVVVHNKAGRIAFERTYPRSSDPKRTKG